MNCVWVQETTFEPGLLRPKAFRVVTRNTVVRVAGAVEQLATLTDDRLNQLTELTNQGLNRPDQIIAMLSAYITGLPPANEVR